MDDRRRPPPRQRTLKSGTIVFNRAGGVTGRVRNLSRTGAMLEVETVIGIPDDFTLLIESDGFRRKCRVVWRQPKRMGVEFI
jgi:hypothetical protein